MWRCQKYVTVLTLRWSIRQYCVFLIEYDTRQFNIIVMMMVMIIIIIIILILLLLLIIIIILLLLLLLLLLLVPCINIAGT